MWQVGRYWINPRNITYVYAQSNDKKIVVHFAAPGEPASAYAVLDGTDREVLLAYLAQHTTFTPVPLTPEQIRRCEDVAADLDARRFDPDEPPF